MRQEVKIMLGIGLLVIAGAVALFVVQPKPVTPSQPVDSSSLVRENSHMTGSKTAKVTVVEFGDFECPACAQAAPIVAQLRTEYKDNSNVNFIFRNFPLPQHKKALFAAEAAEAAGEQGKFWEMHDLLYTNQSKWAADENYNAIFVGFAQQIGLNIDQFSKSWQENKYAEVIRADAGDGTALGVQATPTFFVNGEKLEGMPKSYEAFKQLIEDKLK